MRCDTPSLTPRVPRRRLAPLTDADPAAPCSLDTGANASAEGGDDETAEDADVKVNNIVHSFRLQSTSFDKKGYLAYLKGTVLDL